LEGKPEVGVKGIMPLFEEFMALQKYNKEHVEKVRSYTNFLLARSKGEVPTGAKFMRDFVLNHPAYKQDSVVNNKISYDLMAMIVNMNSSSEERAKFLGKKWLIE
jgi:glutamate--cysteine ligase catalytic subunit